MIRATNNEANCQKFQDWIQSHSCGGIFNTYVFEFSCKAPRCRPKGAPEDSHADVVARMKTGGKKDGILEFHDLDDIDEGSLEYPIACSVQDRTGTAFNLLRGHTYYAVFLIRKPGGFQTVYMMKTVVNVSETKKTYKLAKRFRWIDTKAGLRPVEERYWKADDEKDEPIPGKRGVNYQKWLADCEGNIRSEYSFEYCFVNPERLVVAMTSGQNRNGVITFYDLDGIDNDDWTVSSKCHVSEGAGEASHLRKGHTYLAVFSQPRVNPATKHGYEYVITYVGDVFLPVLPSSVVAKLYDISDSKNN
jgi:hypothetical protein